MKIYRFRTGGPGAISYGYVRANFFERIALRKRIKNGDTGLRTIKQLMQETGGGLVPRWVRTYGASFVITAKKKGK